MNTLPFAKLAAEKHEPSADDHKQDQPLIDTSHLKLAIGAATMPPVKSTRLVDVDPFGVKNYC